MIIIEELRAYMEALALGMWAKGAKQPLVKDELTIARRALEEDLAGPWEDLQALAASISGVTIMATISELNKQGLADVDPKTLAAMMETLPLRVLNEGVVEIADDDEKPAIEQMH